MLALCIIYYVNRGFFNLNATVSLCSIFDDGGSYQLTNFIYRLLFISLTSYFLLISDILTVYVCLVKWDGPSIVEKCIFLVQIPKNMGRGLMNMGK